MDNENEEIEFQDDLSVDDDENIIDATQKIIPLKSNISRVDNSKIPVKKINRFKE